MKQKWIVVAESSRARIFAVDNKNQPLIEIDDMVNPASRVQNHDLVADRPGRNSRGSSQHALEPHSDPQKLEAQRFAQSLSDRLEAGRIGGDFNDLVIVAPSGFMGLLRQHISYTTQKLISHTLTKNLIQKSEAQIRDYLYA
ncbi:MAG: host attachment protein [Methylophaga sp.]|nr:host attachment protein [Methylophaga sp.]